ncbi:MAG: hypothetical protein COA52_01060 [Hyphomicrobiales bacterium]|nr:MAG: hypothetical protein COA52_01060 [Hyphomicrobiales bacterium]
MNQTLNESNFTLYAAKHYDNVHLDTSEFYEDLKRFSYLKRLFNMYEKKEILKENLIINHIIILYNVFGQEATEMLFLRLKGQEELLKTFLLYLNRMPSRIETIRFKSYNEDIKRIEAVWEILNEL